MLKWISKAVATGCFWACVAVGLAQAAEYDHTIESKDMTFSWKIEGDHLAAKVSAKTDGWVGVGFNPSEDMKDANFILGYVKDGEVTLQDDFGVNVTGHKSDESIGGSSDVQQIGGSENDGVTTIEFAIPLHSGDEKDGTIVADGDTVLLLAYGAGRDTFHSRHKYRTSMTVNLATGEVK
ncbi:MAG: DOMON domain-containing protein [Desulfopila sp.]